MGLFIGLCIGAILMFIAIYFVGRYRSNNHLVAFAMQTQIERIKKNTTAGQEELQDQDYRDIVRMVIEYSKQQVPSAPSQYHARRAEEACERAMILLQSMINPMDFNE